MEYLESIIWLISWPIVIYLSYKLVEKGIKRV